MSDNGIERLARRLRRPPSSLAALRQLSPQQLEQLEQLVETACTRQSRELEADLRRALPWPLRLLLGAGS
ncbi:MAG TPA: hypothetical protein VLI06_11950 [Solimonas sp.]|nr:hypothetical protein [Solimonas sp.]